MNKKYNVYSHELNYIIATNCFMSRGFGFGKKYNVNKQIWIFATRTDSKYANKSNTVSGPDSKDLAHFQSLFEVTSKTCSANPSADIQSLLKSLTLTFPLDCVLAYKLL